MARNTNIDELLFEVKEMPVFLPGRETPVPGFRAITGYLEKEQYDKPTVFSIVSGNYHLVKNSQALDLAGKLYKKLFPGASMANFVIFNIIAPNTKSFCDIDIIDKHYEVNIWKKEVYLPFIRVQNSYNRFSALRFDLGFCRKLCDNGVIYEQNTINLKYNHTKAIMGIEDFTHVDTSHFNNLVESFKQKILFTAEITVPLEFFTAMAAKVLGKSFAVDDHDPATKWEATKKLEEFAWIISILKDKYKTEFGETAYTLYNVATDYASNIKHPATSVNSLQWRIGYWLHEFDHAVRQPNFNWHDHLGEYQKLLHKKDRKPGVDGNVEVPF